MSTNESAAPKIPAEITNYIKGAAAFEECQQFDFLIGNWTVDGRRYGANADVIQTFAATWRAQYLAERRMIMDEFTVAIPTGQVVSTFVTLRTYSPITRRWELAGMPAMQPALAGTWNGYLVGDEMHLTAVGPTPDGRTIRNQIRFYDIEDNRFGWESTLSQDDGKTWVKLSSLVAVRTAI